MLFAAAANERKCISYLCIYVRNKWWCGSGSVASARRDTSTRFAHAANSREDLPNKA